MRASIKDWVNSINLNPNAHLLTNNPPFRNNTAAVQCEDPTTQELLLECPAARRLPRIFSRLQRCLLFLETAECLS